MPRLHSLVAGNVWACTLSNNKPHLCAEQLLCVYGTMLLARDACEIAALRDTHPPTAASNLARVPPQCRNLWFQVTPQWLCAYHKYTKSPSRASITVCVSGSDGSENVFWFLTPRCLVGAYHRFGKKNLSPSSSLKTPALKTETDVSLKRWYLPANPHDVITQKSNIEKLFQPICSLKVKLKSRLGQKSGTSIIQFKARHYWQVPHQLLFFIYTCNHSDRKKT